MACPTCNHTMRRLGVEMVRKPGCKNATIEKCRAFWCPRCGTLSELTGDLRRDNVPLRAVREAGEG